MYKSFIMAIAILMVVPLSYAAVVDIPTQHFVAIVVKVLNYDRAVDSDKEGEYVIGLVYDSNDKFQKKTAKDMCIAINVLRQKTAVQTLKLNSVLFDLALPEMASKDGFNEAVVNQNVAAVISVLTTSDDYDFVVPVLRQNRVNTFCSDVSGLKKGFAFAIGVSHNKPKLFVNVQAAKEEGSDYSGRILSLAEKVK